MKTNHARFRPLMIAVLATAAAQAQETSVPAVPVTPPTAEQTPATPVTPPAAANPAADLTAAVEKLASAKNYAWSQTASFGNMEPRTTTGKKGSGGYLLMNVPGRDQEMQVLVRKGKATLKTDDGWVSAEAAAGGEGQGPGRFLARMMQNSREPVLEVKELIGKATNLKNENGKFSATLSEEAARSLMAFGGGGRRGGGGGGGGGGNNTPPAISGAAGTVTFTVANGILSGYETTLTGKMSFNGEEREVNRTTKVEFTGVGSTTFDIPEAAAGLLAE